MKERRSRREKWAYEMVELPEEERQQIISTVEQIVKEDSFNPYSDEISTQNSENLITAEST